jgi:rSAM/selenodomain-associated transferase 2
MRVSVIIPTLNEAAELPATLAHLRLAGVADEIIVADGGSHDDTVELARAAGIRVIPAPRGRGYQLRAGAAVASGEALVFLHADTWVPAGGLEAVRRALADRGVVAGAFEKAFRDGSPWLAGSRWKCRVRMHLLQFAYADQAVFVRRDALMRSGGFPAVPLMEEHELFRQLDGEGSFQLLPEVVLTSARRFQRSGVIRTYWRMLGVELGWRLGVPTGLLARWYRGR